MPRRKEGFINSHHLNILLRPFAGYVVLEIVQLNKAKKPTNYPRTMTQRRSCILVSFLLAAAVVFVDVSNAWVPSPSTTIRTPTPTTTGKSSSRSTSALFALQTEEKTKTAANDSVEATTEKYGLEAGLFQSMKQEDGGETAKSLLKKYGIAYLATSIPLALVSFVICYVLVDNGVDVGALLAKVGIQGETQETAGTFAIAYAAHKAASPIRFPPTVLLTPVVAKMIGKEPESDVEEEAAGP